MNLNGWNLYPALAPEPGQEIVALLRFKSSTRKYHCFYDTKLSWQDRIGDYLDDEETMPSWLTHPDDEDDWTDTTALAYWIPVPPPPSEDSDLGR